MNKGIGVSSGIAIGRAFVLPNWDWEFPDKEINVEDLANEFERLYNGIHHSKNEIQLIKQEISTVVGANESSIFDAHLAILDDPTFMSEVQGIIQRQYKAAEVAVKEVIEQFVTMFDLLEDEYMRERANDIKDVGNRLLQHLLGAPEITLPDDNQPFILVAHELTPSQLAHLNPEHVSGISTMVGGRNSHAAIMAKSMGIPLVIGLEGKIARPIQTGDFLIMDGSDGTLLVNPIEEDIERYQIMRSQLLEERDLLRKLIHVPAKTLDGQTVKLESNISTLKEVEQVIQYGAEGVGLFRTEFIYMDRSDFPTEDELFEVYRVAAEKMEHKPLVIRTLDIGGDKQLEYHPFQVEDNPFLGYRAIRISLDDIELFKTQLRAILRASYFGNIKLMFPMISSLDELQSAKLIFEEVKEELRIKGVPFNEQLEIGIMIEVPAAAAIADLLAPEVDFFSIGTNDLIQYVLAVDRMNEKIAHLYDPFHPAIIRLLAMTVEAAKRHGISVGVCGELAGDLRALPIWLGLGVYELSMSIQSILEIKQLLLRMNVNECQLIVQQVMRCRSSKEICELLDDMIQ